MHLQVDTESSTPVHEQITEQVTRQVLGGVLPPGTRLPSIRQLAADLGLAAGTVARAYRELELAEVVHTRRPQGTYVTSTRFPPGRRQTALRQLAQRFAAQAEQLGVSADDALAAVRAAYPPQ